MSYYFAWRPYVSVAEKRRQAEREAGQAEEAGTIHRSGDDRGPHDCQELLGPVVVHQPRTLQRLSRTACRAAAPMSAMVPLSTCKSPRARSRRWSPAPISTRSRSPSRRSRTARWKAICRDCAGTIDSLVELLQGRLAKGVMDRVCREGDGLFPSPGEIKLSCSCPDWADMCKHVAAVLYGVGARLDEKPQLLFVLRGVDENELIASAGQDLSLTKATPGAAKVLDDSDVAALFGLEMAETASSDIPTARKQPRRSKTVKGSKSAETKTRRQRKTSHHARPGPSPSLNGSALVRARKRRAQRRRDRAA